MTNSVIYLLMMFYSKQLNCLSKIHYICKALKFNRVFCIMLLWSVIFFHVLCCFTITQVLCTFSSYTDYLECCISSSINSWIIVTSVHSNYHYTQSCMWYNLGITGLIRMHFCQSLKIIVP